MHHLIVGAASSNCVKVWVRGYRSQTRAICELRSKHEKHEKRSDLVASTAFIDVLHFRNLTPNTRYEVAFQLQDHSGKVCQEQMGAVVTFPEDCTEVCFLAGSCHFHGWAPFFRDDRVAIERLRDLVQPVSFSLQMGDQVYTDRPLPCYSQSDFRAAYNRTWGRKPMTEFLATNAHFMLPSDHEIINDFEPDGELSLKQRILLLLRGQLRPKFQTLLKNGREVFREQQRSHAARAYGSDVHYDEFSYGSFHFFLMDQRFERSTSKGEMLSPKQLDKLSHWLATHKEEVCFVVGESPFLYPRNAKGGWGDPAFKEQRRAILSQLYKIGNPRVVFLSGDVHASYHATAFMESPTEAPLTLNELVCSPINATLMKSRSKFPDLQRISFGEAVCHSEMNEDSFVGPAHAYDTMASSIGVLNASQKGVEWELWRTRRKESEPILRASFEFSKGTKGPQKDNP